MTKLIGNNKQQGPNYWKTLTAQAPPTLELPLLQHDQLHAALQGRPEAAGIITLQLPPSAAPRPALPELLCCWPRPERQWWGKLSLIYSCIVPRSADLQGAEPPVMEMDQGIDVSGM